MGSFCIIAIIASSLVLRPSHTSVRCLQLEEISPIPRPSHPSVVTCSTLPTYSLTSDLCMSCRTRGVLDVSCDALGMHSHLSSAVMGNVLIRHALAPIQCCDGNCPYKACAHTSPVL